VIDALLKVVRRKYSFSQPPLSEINFAGKRIVLVTAHRRENWGKVMEEICQAISRLIETFSDIEVVFSVHKNPVVQRTVKKLLLGKSRVHLLEPVDYEPFCHLMAHSYLILSDSGGVQEEAPSLGKPVLVLRDVTERPEGIEAGTVKLAGTAGQRIFSEAAKLLSDEKEYEKMAKAVNPYGDGKASQRIVKILKEHLNEEKKEV
jgi:UDP-N-acetylglucosamine 2-epimerase (non-hydrolysing)